MREWVKQKKKCIKKTGLGIISLNRICEHVSLCHDSMHVLVHAELAVCGFYTYIRLEYAICEIVRNSDLVSLLFTTIKCHVILICCFLKCKIHTKTIAYMYILSSYINLFSFVSVFAYIYSYRVQKSNGNSNSTRTKTKLKKFIQFCLCVWTVNKE